MNIYVDIEGLAQSASLDILEGVRDELTQAVRNGARRAIESAVAVYFTNGPGKQAVAEAVAKSLDGKPIHV